MAGSQIATSVTIINSLLGYQGISLTNYDTSALSAIAAGSKIEIASAFFTFTTDETINASSWTAITTATSAYLYLTPSGTAGSQILSASWESTAPTWITSKQGWYSSAGSNIRVVAQSYKVSNTRQSTKTLLVNPLLQTPMMYTGSNYLNEEYPIGSILLVNADNSGYGINSIMSVWATPAGAIFRATDLGGLTLLNGVWLNRGAYIDTLESKYVILAQRIS